MKKTVSKVAAATKGRIIHVGNSGREGEGVGEGEGVKVGEGEGVGVVMNVMLT